MDKDVAKGLWGGLAFRGMLTIVFGIAAVFWPKLTLVTLVYLFSSFVLATGLVNLIVGLTNLSNEGGSALTRILLILIGAIEVGVGVYLLRHPTVSFATLVLLIGFTLIISGVVEIFSGLFDDYGATHRTATVIGGLLATLAGVLVLFAPAASGVAFVWILGLYALITGPLLVAVAMDAKKILDAPSRSRK